MKSKCMGLLGILLVLSVSFFGCSSGGGGSTPPPTPPSTPPSAPTNLVATAGNSTVGLTWTAVSDAASYNVYRGAATGALGTKTKIATGLLSAAYNDSTAANGTTYYYQVTAVNANGESGGSTEKSVRPRGTGSWTATSITGAPSARALHSSVWTGTEILIWGGTDDGVTGLDTGGRYDPATDSWTAITTTNAPSARFEARAQWIALSVNKWIVWGGTNDGYTTGLNTGGLYDPASNSWATTTTTNAPQGRFYHTMVRSGSKVIVWGGTPNDTNGLNTGGVYDPAGNSWTATNTAGAPSARLLHRAVRRGTFETMIVWGGTPDYTAVLNTGGVYDPAGDSWTATNTAGAPSARADHNAVLAPNIGMIVWGGTPDGNTSLNTGGIYNAGTDSWTATSTVGAPSARIDNSAEWTGTEMIVWGGSPDYTTTTTLNTGGRYDPATDTWTATTTVNAPSARAAYRSDWTGTEMIVWGGTPDYATTLNTGGRYTP